MSTQPPPYCYPKHYAMRPNGCVILTNPEPAKAYIEEKMKLLLQCRSHQEELDLKLQIFREFQEIYAYDCVHAVRPEPFGTFIDQKEKEDFVRLKQLVEDFCFYLGTIFCNYHENLARQKKPIPILVCSRLVINYSELYVRAVNEYFGTLLGYAYPLSIQPTGAAAPGADYLGVRYQEYRGILLPVSQEQPANQTDHACGTTFILPALIDHFLLMYLQNRILFNGLETMAREIKAGNVTLEEEEQVLFASFVRARQEGSGIYGGKQEQTMRRVYRMFVRYHILGKEEDKEQLLVGQSKGKPTTLGAVLYSQYAKQEIRPEYYELIQDLFHTKKLNIRNCIMHGNSVTYDYLSIGIAAVMLQLLWDIAGEDIFI